MTVHQSTATTTAMAVVVGRGGEEGSAKRAMTRDDALCGPGASLDGTDLSMGG